MAELMSLLMPAIGWSLLHFLWQGLLIGWAAALALHVLRNARPQARYAVATIALLLCAALPLGGVVWRVLDGVDVAAAMPAAVSVIELAGSSAAAAMPLLLGPEQRISWETVLQRQLPWLVLLWAAGAAVMTLRLSLGLLWVHARTQPGQYRSDPYWQRRLNRLARQFGLAGEIRLGVAEQLDGPMTAGCWKPIVLLPASLLSGMPADLLEALLAHELAHIKRHDYLVNLIQSAIEILLFYHPSVWTLSNRIRIEREQIADDLAASALGEPRRLALALSELDRFQFAPPQFAPAAQGGNLMSRIKRLVRPDTEPLSWKIAAPLLGLCTACAMLYAHAAPSAPAASEGSAQVSNVSANESASAAAKAAAAQAAAATQAAGIAASAASAAGAEAAQSAGTAASAASAAVAEAAQTASQAASFAAAAAAEAAQAAAEAGHAAQAAQAAGAAQAESTGSLPTPPKPPKLPKAPKAPAIAQAPVPPSAPPVPPIPAAPPAIPSAPPAMSAAVPPVPALPAPPAPPPRLYGSGSQHITINDRIKDGYAVIRGGRDLISISGKRGEWEEIKRLQQNLKSDFIWYRKDGKAYLIQDSALVAKAADAWVPVDKLGAKMDEHGAVMDAHGKVLDRLGAKMDALSEQAEGSRAERGQERKLEAMVRKQEMIGRKMEAVGRRMDGDQSVAQREASQREMAQLRSQMEPLQSEINKAAQDMGRQHARQALSHEPMQALGRQMEEASKPMAALGQKMGELGREQERASRAADQAVRRLIEEAHSKGQATPVAPKG